MSRVEIFYATCCLETQTVSPTLPGFQGIKRRVQYLASHPYKTICYPFNYYNGSNVIIITCSVDQFEYHTTQKHL